MSNDYVILICILYVEVEWLYVSVEFIIWKSGIYTEQQYEGKFKYVKGRISGNAEDHCLFRGV